MMPCPELEALTDRSRVCYFTLISAAQDVAHRALGFTEVHAE